MKLDIAAVWWWLKETRSTRRTAKSERYNFVRVRSIGPIFVSVNGRPTVHPKFEGRTAPSSFTPRDFIEGGSSFYCPAARSRYLLIVEQPTANLCGICVTGLISTSGRKLDRENQAEHVLEVS